MLFRSLDGDIKAMRGRGVDVGNAVEGGRVAPSGVELKWKAATLGAKNALPLVFVQHLTALDERRRQVPGAGSHPNGVTVLDRAYIVTDDLEAAAALYAKVLGLPQPAIVKGTVIMSNMAVFQIGPHGLGVVQPYADGPAADEIGRAHV